MKVRSLVSGVLSITPLWKRTQKESGGTDSSRYCYSVWLRHLSIAHELGLSTRPNSIAELGPGNSLGTGLAGLITGAQRYYAFDVHKHSKFENNLKILDELSELFRAQADIPDEKEFPEVKPTLKSYQFPKQILPDIYLSSCLKEDRILSIKNAVLNCEQASISESPIQIQYFAPWHHSEIIEDESVDVIFSQAVLEYIEDLEQLYRAFYRWLKPGGWMSHQIDFRCHGLASAWNGHWAYSDFTWKIIKGKRPYVINRVPHSVHLSLQKEIGFKIIADLQVKERIGLERKQLAKKFRAISDEDFTISTAHVVSIKEK